jgi:translation initiation factor 1
MKREKYQKIPEASGKLSHNPFAALAGRREDLPAGEAAPEVPPEAPPEAPAAPRRAAVRLERKGRGGKEVTLVEGLGLPAEELSRWLSDCKQALGCGGAVEGDALALQGDQRERVRAFLAARGVKKIAGA